MYFSVGVHRIAKNVVDYLPISTRRQFALLRVSTRFTDVCSHTSPLRLIIRFSGFLSVHKIVSRQHLLLSKIELIMLLSVAFLSVVLLEALPQFFILFVIVFYTRVSRTILKPVLATSERFKLCSFAIM